MSGALGQRALPAANCTTTGRREGLPSTPWLVIDWLLVMADFDIKKIISERWGENYELHEKYLNPTLVKVFRTIGFDKVYTKAQGAYLWDKEGNRYLDLLSGFGVFSLGRNHPQI